MKMGKYLAFVLLAMLCIGLFFGCGNAGAESSVPASTDAQEQTAPTHFPEDPLPTEHVTEPAREETQPQSILGKNQRKINVFLSSFAETFFEGYPCSKYDMLMFGLIHCKINSGSKLKYDNDKEYITREDMDAVLTDYFGKTVQPESERELFFADGYDDIFVAYDAGRYMIDAADGESYDYLAVVSSMEKNPDGTYAVEFDIYYAEEGLRSAYYDFSAEEAVNAAELEWTGRGKATVRDYTRSNGKESYQVIRYLRG